MKLNKTDLFELVSLLKSEMLELKKFVEFEKETSCKFFSERYAILTKIENKLMIQIYKEISKEIESIVKGGIKKWQ